MFTEVKTVIDWFFQDIVARFFLNFLMNNKWATFAFMLPICLSLIMLFMLGILHISSLRMPQASIHNFIEMPKFPVKIRRSADNRMIERETATVDPVTGELHIRKSYTKTRKLTRKERKSANELLFDN